MKTNSLIQAVAYSMECALATIESEADKKKPSKSVINRHIAIVRNVLIDTLAAAESPEEATELKNDMVNYSFNYSSNSRLYEVIYDFKCDVKAWADNELK
jgi:hypothetical protein